MPTLTKTESDILCYIYALRCLTVDQIYREFFQKQKYSVSHTEAILNHLVDSKYITAVSFTNPANKDADTAFFLTRKGCNTAKEYYLEYPAKFPRIAESCKQKPITSAKLTLNENNIPHQLCLNNIALALIRAHPHIPSKPYTWCDELFMTEWHYGSRRAVADALADSRYATLYMELDMSTERHQRLFRKWEGYRTLYASGDFYERNREKPQHIMFISDNTPAPVARAATVIGSLAKNGLLYDFTTQKDFFIGTPDEIARASIDLLYGDWEPKLKQPFLRYAEKNGIRVGEPDAEYPFDCTAKADGVLYGVDFLDTVRGSVLNRIACFGADIRIIRSVYGRDVRHLVVTNDAEAARRIVRAAGCGDAPCDYWHLRKNGAAQEFRLAPARK